MTQQGRSPEKIRVAIAGAGYISVFHVQALRQLGFVELTAVCDNDTAKASAFQRRWNLAEAYDSIDSLLAQGRPDVVQILTPPRWHASTALACVEAGCHVFLEKPATTTLEEARQLAAAAAKAGVQVGINHNNVFHPGFQRLIGEIEDWRLGGLEHLTAVMNVPLRQLAAGQHAHWMFQQLGNIVLEQATHPLSQILTLLGPLEDCTVLPTGTVTLNNGKPFVSVWQISMRCRRGTAQCFLSFGRDHHEYWLYAIGQDGAAMLDLRRNTLTFTGKTRWLPPADALLNSAGAGWSAMRQAWTGFSDYALGFLKLKKSADPFSAGMNSSVGAFYEALRQGKRPPVTIAEGLEVVEACERIGAAAAAYFEKEHGRG